MLSLISAGNPIGFVKSSDDSNVDWKSVMSGKAGLLVRVPGVMVLIDSVGSFQCCRC